MVQYKTGRYSAVFVEVAGSKLMCFMVEPTIDDWPTIDAWPRRILIVTRSSTGNQCRLACRLVHLDRQKPSAAERPNTPKLGGHPFMTSTKTLTFTPLPPIHMRPHDTDLPPPVNFHVSST